MKLELYYPVYPIIINQPFGQNAEYYKKEYGVGGHNGIDFHALDGTPVYAAHDGTCYPGIDGNGGNGVVIQTDKEFDYQDQSCRFKSIYWHLKKADAVVKTGQKVKSGDLIGYADNTGKSTGSHLHFGLKPQAWNESDWTWCNVEQNNGFLGAIDPTPYWNGKYAHEAQFLFTRDLAYGLKEDSNVRQLQSFLRKYGYFTFPENTGNYGELTQLAVWYFQLDHVPDLSVWEKYVLRGKRVGEKTRKVLNDIIQHQIP